MEELEKAHSESCLKSENEDPDTPAAAQPLSFSLKVWWLLFSF